MNRELTNPEKTRKLPWALAGDATNVVYVYLAFSGPIFLLFLDSLGLDKSQIGVLLSIFPFCGLVALFSLPIAARVGFKRVFLGFWVARKTVMAAMIAAPWVIGWYGLKAGFVYVAVIILVFAICRSIAETALSPWYQEFVPNTIRGKYNAIQNIVVVIVGAITMALAGYFLGDHPRTGRFIWLFVIALVFGFVTVAFYARVPGGAPVPGEGNLLKDSRTVLGALRDPRLRLFLFGGAMVTFGWAPMTAFLPLFWKEHVGLRSDQVVYLDSVVLVAGLFSCYLWGWAADRYGSKPVMVFNLAMLVLYPIGLMLAPRHGDHAFAGAAGLVFLVGLVLPGWAIGYNRYFYVTLVPPEHKTAYVAVHSAFVGVTAGFCPLIAGKVLGWTSGLNGRAPLGWLHIDPYTPLFLAALVLLCAATYLLSRLPTRGEMEVTRFAGMFLQGSPWGAVQALIAYQMGGDERRRITTIERLGQTMSPLSVEELIESLNDPSFNVRYETIVSIARTRPDPRLTEAVIGVLREPDPDLNVAAVWALGRIGDPAAIGPLRAELASPYLTLRARAARSLAMLNDRGSARALHKLFMAETDLGVRLAYAAALGALRREESLPAILDFLRGFPPSSGRSELLLAAASIIGRDDLAVRLWKRVQERPADALADATLDLKKRLAKVYGAAALLEERIDRCARLLGRGDFTGGAAELRALAAGVRPEALTPPAAAALRDALHAMERFGGERPEYLVLCLHALHAGLEPEATTGSSWLPAPLGE